MHANTRSKLRSNAAVRAAQGQLPVRPVAAPLTSVADPCGLVDDHAVCFDRLARRNCSVRQPATLVVITSAVHPQSLQLCRCYPGRVQHQMRPAVVACFQRRAPASRDQDLGCWRCPKHVSEARHNFNTVSAFCSSAEHFAAGLTRRCVRLLSLEVNMCSASRTLPAAQTERHCRPVLSSSLRTTCTPCFAASAPGLHLESKLLSRTGFRGLAGILAFNRPAIPLPALTRDQLTSAG